MINDVPPSEMLVLPTFENFWNNIGSAAITTRNRVPNVVILSNTLVIYFLVSSPGLTPGIYPPFCCKFLAISSGLN